MDTNNSHNAKVFLYVDDNPHPVAELQTPIVFNLDTTKLTDGEHQLKIISQFATSEGIKTIPFTVRNGPIINIEGLKKNETVNGVIPLMINAYDTGKKQSFIIKGSENPRVIPVWLWVVILLFGAWAIYYLIANFSI
ncbi:cytochrome C [Chryseobacterium sp. A301]